MSIHPSAIISSEAIIEDGVEIGPYCIIKGRVKIGKGTIIESHNTIGTDHAVVEIGENNHFWPYSFIGGPPQDLTYKNNETKLIVGNNNNIREYTTLNLGTLKGGGVTSIGNDNLIMAYCHIGHDCKIGNENTIANCANLAGHVEVADKVKISGLCGAIQFVRIGKHGYLAANSSLNKDMLPFTIAQGIYAKSRATNKIGLERAGFSKDEIQNIHKAVRVVLKGDKTVEASVQQIQAECEMTENIKYFLDFLQSSKNGVAK